MTLACDPGLSRANPHLSTLRQGADPEIGSWHTRLYDTETGLLLGRAFSRLLGPNTRACAAAIGTLESSFRIFTLPESENIFFGFRVAAVPEPVESTVVVGVAAVGYALWRRRGSR